MIVTYSRTTSGSVRRHDWGAPIQRTWQPSCDACGWLGSVVGVEHATIEAKAIARREEAAHQCPAKDAS